MSMKNCINAYLITCQTNLHVGSGTGDQGVIDNLVQRDPVDDMPAIYASSLKGAFREFMKFYLPQNDLETIFGSENPVGRSDSKSQRLKKGEIIFHDAILFSVPVRSNKRPYFHATCPMLLKRIVEFRDLLILDREEKKKLFFFQNLEGILAGLKGRNKYPYVGVDIDSLIIESFNRFTKEESKLSEMMKECVAPEENWVIFSDEEFRMLVDNYSLPVIARNYLNNGESKNLFYEQIVPRQSRFVFFISSYSGDITKISKANGQFDQAIQRGAVQIGANASIGYGYCKLETIAKVGGTDDEK